MEFATVRATRGEAAIARLVLADAHAASGSQHRAALERQAARTILEAIRSTPPMAAPARVEHHDAPAEQPVAGVNIFRREADYWSVIFDGDTAHVRDLKGMHYLARLLAEPGREYHVLDLVAAETGRVSPAGRSRAADFPHSALGDAGEMIDAWAKDAYRRRLAEIDDDIAQARCRGRWTRRPGRRRTRLPRSRARTRVRPERPGSSSRVRVRARSSRCDPRGPPGDSADR
jgi:hypothetical protein